MTAEHANQFLTNLAVVLCVAAVTTVVFQRLRQPVVLGYLLAGLIVGPHVPVPLVADRAIVQELSELGVILLLFSIGLEFTFGKLVRVGGRAAIVAVVEVSIMLVLGTLAGRGFGWSPLNALYAGAIVAISSTTIIAKAFEEQRTGGRLRELVLAMLVVEDLVAILLLASFTAAASGGLSATGLLLTAGRLVLFIAGCVAVGMLVVPRFVRFALALDRPETAVVACTGICFAFALLAQRFGYSVALGAFLAGTLVAESKQGERVEHLIRPVRDLLAAVFFVSVGMSIDPVLVVAHWKAIAGLTAVVLAGKAFGVAIPAVLTGAGVRTSVQAGMTMAQIGEFSFIIAGVGVALGATGDFLYPVAVSVSALTTLTTPWMIRASGGVAEWVDAILPRRLQTFLALTGAWVESLGSRSPTRVRRLVRLLLLDLAILTGVVVASARLFDRSVAWLEPRLGLRLAETCVAAFAVAAGAPFVVGIVRLVGALVSALATQALPVPGQGIDLSAAPRRALIVSLQLVAAIVLGLPLVAVTQLFLPAYAAVTVFAALLVALAVRLWRTTAQLQGHVRAGAQVLVEALAQPSAAGPAQAPFAAIFPGLGSPEAVPLAEGSPGVGRTLRELDLRGQTGATVLAIRRGGKGVLMPTGQEQLLAGDVLAVAGSHEALDATRAMLSSTKSSTPTAARDQK